LTWMVEASFAGMIGRAEADLTPRGGSLSFRYRLVIHSGGLDANALEQLYTSFSGGKCVQVYGKEDS
jgi:hypothetical protein